MAKDCDQPRNPEKTQCRNCDELGHFSKDCPKPRDYSRVKCSNCGQMGHTIRVSTRLLVSTQMRANSHSVAKSQLSRTGVLAVAVAVAGVTLAVPLMQLLLLAEARTLGMLAETVRAGKRHVLHALQALFATTTTSFMARPGL